MFALGFLMVLAITTITVGFAQETDVVELAPTDDAFVLHDGNDPDDIQGLQTINTGNFTFTKVWYAFNVTENNNFISSAYLKFDLSDWKQEQIDSAHLNMYAENLQLMNSSRELGVYITNSSDWKESTLTYQNAPLSFGPTSISDVTSPDWYQWNVTDTVKEFAGSDLTFVVFFSSIFTTGEELAIFASKDSDDPSLRPKLVIETPIVTAPALISDDSTIIAAIIAAIAAGGIGGIIIFKKRKVQKTKPLSKPIQVTCPNCKKSISSDFNICPYCEYNLKPKCKNCGKLISREFKVCPYCGYRV